MQRGFFSEKELQEYVKQSGSNEPDCTKCKLDKKCTSPMIPIRGKGKKKILMVVEMPGKESDRVNRLLSGRDGKILDKYLSEIGLSLNEDFWITSAIHCRSAKANGSDLKPKTKNIKSCKPLLDKAIIDLKPEHIWLMGSTPIASFFADKFSNLTAPRYINLCIPDRDSNAWVTSFFHQSHIRRKKDDQNLIAEFRRNLKSAKSNLTLEPYKHEDLEQYTTILSTFDGVEDFLSTLLREIKERFTPIFLDYETTSLKPHWTESKIVTVSIATGPNNAYAFPFQWKDFFTSKEIRKIKSLLRKIFTHRNTGLMAQNMKFEDAWTRNIIGVTTNQWLFDTMLMSHIIDNRRSFTGLKFQSYVQFGVDPYDTEISKFLKSSSGSHINNVEKAPLKELLYYNCLDTLLGFRLYNKQQEYFNLSEGLHKKNKFAEAYKLFHNGILALSDAQENGVLTKEGYYEEKGKLLEGQIKDIKEELMNGIEAAIWVEKMGEKELKLNSSKVLGHLLYVLLGEKEVKTDKGNWKTDKETLETMDRPFIKKLLEMRKLEKVLGTYIAQIRREVCNGVIHPFYDLHIPISGRSCLAEGTKILMPKYFLEFPNGVPIEEVKEGDYVYCFDDNLKPTVKKVLWAGKTGHRKVIRLHYYCGGGKYEYLDCTPEHKIRLIDGTYQKAIDFLHYKNNKKWNELKNNRVLSGGRTGDELRFTFCGRNGRGILEHRFIYENFIGPLTKKDVIHHRDKNHYNHEPSNLKKMSLSTHSKLHSIDTVCTEKARENSVKAVKRGWKEGKYKNATFHGKDHSNWLGLTYYQCLKALAKQAGRVKWASDSINVDFDTFKKYLTLHKINWKTIRLRYDKNNQYISRKRLQELSIFGRAEVKNILGHNHYRLLDLYNYYGVDTTRQYGNQFTKVSNNHFITDIEILDIKKDVYDIEVEDAHNFIANEICVHNSSSMPNWQNIPGHDPVTGPMIREGIVPPEGWFIGEADYSSIEVKTAAMYTQDPSLIKYVTDPTTDMHRDTACDIWLIPQEQVTKDIRYNSKGGWVFSQFYGSYYVNCAEDLWKTCITHPEELADGTPMREHLHDKGIHTKAEFVEHLRGVEDIFWNQRFKVYKQWKEDTNKQYRKRGFIENYFGFRFTGYMTDKEVTNYPIQSTAFHILLEALTEVNRISKDDQWQSYIIGQIHDSIMLYIHPDERDMVLQTCNRVMTEYVVDKHDWITVPIDIEFELSDKSWWDKKEVPIPNGN